MACCLLHNFIRTNSEYDPEEDNVPDIGFNDDANNVNYDFIENVEPSQEWTNWREQLALSMYNDWLARRGQ